MPMGEKSQRWLGAATSGKLLVIVSSAVVVGFLAATWLSQRHAAKIDEAADSIISNAMPSVQHLGAARTDLHRLDAAAQRYASARLSGETPADEWVDTPRRDLNGALESYLALPFYPDERDLYKGTAAALGHLDEEIGRMKMVGAGTGASLSQILAQARADIARIDANLQQIVDFDAAQGQRLGSEIAATRRHAARMAYSLNLACLLLAVVATVLAVTEVQRSARILRELGRAQQERADLFEQRCIELEQFGDRVAHDIMSPLAAVSVALAVAQKTSGTDPDARRIIDRGLATLMR